ncbi:homeotic protein spalt-major-like isoform X6 [Macrosteles quadrilineatus]|uniref:homeotic protein spalt-major-like isoform X6 n=1 Tax=Macrosteles quadrilineatus TaxID=74068 RepID=UPI0023E289E7|nr:homeotic protein spalt-major-like isoform X6 [Macrosteles quadrilineatus]
MSRRKQARPIRVFESEDGLETEAPQNGDGPITDSEEEATSPRDDNVCDNCNAEFSNVQEAEDHRKECIPPKDVEVLDSPGSGENDEMPLSGDEEDEESSLPEEGKRQEEVRRQKQDAENNNSVEDGETEGEGEDLPLGFPFQLPAAAAAGHVTLEALQNTKVAVAQFAATAMANNTDNAAALQELAVLQSTLYTLQTQQMMQLNLIQQLQQQLQITRPKDGSPTPPLPLTITPRPSHSPLPPSLPKPSRTPTPVKQEIPMAITTPTTQSVPASAPQATTPTSAPKPVTASPPIHTPSLPPCSISSSFASSIITNLDPPPSPSEPNTLEMLQRRAQEVLDNASQGLLANNLADELAFRKNGGKSMSPYDSKTGGRNEPFFKHRCRYCGKVFGSDSALQIHIRSHTVNGEKSPPGSSPSGSEGQLTPSPQTHLHSHLLPRPTQRPPSPAASESGSLGALDLTPRTSTGVFSGFGLLPTSALSSLTSSVLTSTAFSPMGLAVGPAVRGNTTCNICFKTFACNSALEIHYRSHTKERPFKCTICDRGFSTKGNMKQHMLTHKIRDMPSHLFEQKSPTDDTSNASSESRDIGCVRALEAPQTPTQPPVGPPLTPTGPPPPKEPNLQQQLQLYQSPQHHQHQHHQQHQQHQHQHHQPPPPPQPVKRSPEESILPLPKRQPSLPKHLCHVCNKNFSSSSALQIHMRTHTGDKPFRCTICHKAFTTKGNLKVHMGTHMWTNGASRRGRRMSLDLPPLPITPKDSDFLHRRPDLFYPYLPAPFLNGMQQKLNEISVIQNVGSNMSNGLLGFGGYRALEMKPGSPGSEKQPLGSPQHRSTPPLWDLHYDRKPPTAPDSPPAHVPPPRGEGLAA